MTVPVLSVKMAVRAMMVSTTTLVIVSQDLKEIIVKQVWVNDVSNEVCAIYTFLWAKLEKLKKEKQNYIL